jgi:acyl phosphate:glycerol-3-phosphate acyltransferase
MLEILVKLIIGYLAGSIGSLVVGRLRGIDIRQLGSGNAGGTNALRTQGKLFALAGGADRRAQGRAAGAVADRRGPARRHRRRPGGRARDGGRRDRTGAVIGHVWPVFFGLRGGKGMATLLGAYGAIQPLLLRRSC